MIINIKLVIAIVIGYVIKNSNYIHHYPLINQPDYYPIPNKT
jgi:hypothetical protein